MRRRARRWVGGDGLDMYGWRWRYNAGRERRERSEGEGRKNRLLASRVRSSLAAGMRLAVSSKCWLLRAMPC